ncbi:5 -methylthioadenosine S-adenosylhomocysteine nucleosidase-like isoform X16 [Paramuricea clavata]|uniref:5 -methylthioadenosine S-adenosylhomocysteine nucleosidase-like isoform X16 n=1 Tax=Paramuricea clavata TaxID=317549 RepID=A0A7D9EJ01_PARCT|nr:5 -methylthioadenosine S-adenosylhomocysteine nucleosidase-like isoform X16 [Paramuricea clavata]
METRKMGQLSTVAPKRMRVDIWLDVLWVGDGWAPPLRDRNSLKVEVHRVAVMLSGPDLVDNLERRQELLNYFREALGLEMEGAGLHAAAYDLGIEWAVIKGVADFNDGSKSVTGSKTVIGSNLPV